MQEEDEPDRELVAKSETVSSSSRWSTSWQRPWLERDVKPPVKRAISVDLQPELHGEPRGDHFKGSCRPSPWHIVVKI